MVPPPEIQTTLPSLVFSSLAGEVLGYSNPVWKWPHLASQDPRVWKGSGCWGNPELQGRLLIQTISYLWLNGICLELALCFWSSVLLGTGSVLLGSDFGSGVVLCLLLALGCSEWIFWIWILHFVSCTEQILVQTLPCPCILWQLANGLVPPLSFLIGDLVQNKCLHPPFPKPGT